MRPDDGGPSPDAAPESPRRPTPIDRWMVATLPGLRRHLIICVAAAIATAAAIVAQAEVLARGIAHMVDAASSGPSSLQMAFGMAAVGAVRAGTAAAVERSSARTLDHLRQTIPARVIDAAVGNVEPVEPHQAAALAVDAPRNLESYVDSFLPSAALAMVVPLVAGVRILTVDLPSAVIAAVTVPLIPVFMVLIGRLTAQRQDRSWATMNRLGHHFSDVLAGLPTLRLFGRAEAQAESVRRTADQYRRSTMAMLRVAFLSGLALDLLATLSVAIIAVEVGLRLASGSVALTSALTVLLLIPEVYLPLRRVGANFHAAQDGRDAAADVRDLVEAETLPTGDVVPAHSGTLELRGVVLRVRVAESSGAEGFGAEARDHDVAVDDLVVQPGELAAVVAPSGTGKSLLLNSVRGRSPLRAGSITWAGEDVRTFNRDRWATQVAYIPQRPVPSHATAREVAGSGLAVPRDAVIEALDQLGLADVADRPTDQLSGGQRRRVMVAYAVLAVQQGATLVLADEPTAQLDDTAADLVIEALSAMALDGATVLAATHDSRLMAVATLRHAIASGRSDWPGGATAMPLADNSRSRSGTVARGAKTADAVRSDRTGGAPETPLADDSRSRVGAVAAAVGQARGVSGSADAHQGWVAVRSVLGRVRVPRLKLALAIAAGVMAEATTLGLAAVAAWLVLRASEHPPVSALLVAAAIVRAFGTTKGLFRYLERLASHDAGLTVLGEVRATLIDRLARIRPDQTTTVATASRVRATIRDVDGMLDLVVRAAVPWATTLVSVGGAVAITAAIDAGAGATLAVSAVLLVMVAPRWVARSEGRAICDRRNAEQDLAVVVTDAVGTIDLLVDRGMVGSKRLDVAALVDRLDLAAAGRSRRRMVVDGLSAAVPAFTVAATALVVDPSTVSRGVFGVLLLWPLAVLELAATASNAAEGLAEGVVAAEGVASTFATPVEEPVPARHDPRPFETPHSVMSADVLSADAPSGDSLSVDTLAGDTLAGDTLAVEALRARWTSDGPSIGPVSLAGGRGDRVTIEGPSGAGKSTVAAALVDYCPNDSDRFEVDGRDRSEVGGPGLRSSVMWVDQQPWIADTTVAANLRIGNPEATDEDLREALEVVALGEWLRARPLGLEALVGRNGANLSGGEAHRLAIARACLARHRTVVLDEPMSHLDTATEQTVSHRLDQTLSDRFVITLTHNVGPGLTVSQRDRSA